MIKIFKDGVSSREEIFSVVEPKMDVSSIVSEIIEDVKLNGDKALYKYAEKFDKVKLSSLAVKKEEIENAAKSVDKEFLRILNDAAKNIREFHSKQKSESFSF